MRMSEERETQRERQEKGRTSGTRGAWRGGQRRRQEISGSYCLTASVKGRHCSCSACDPQIRSTQHRGRRCEPNAVLTARSNVTANSISDFSSNVLEAVRSRGEWIIISDEAIRDCAATAGESINTTSNRKVQAEKRGRNEGETREKRERNDGETREKRGRNDGETREKRWRNDGETREKRWRNEGEMREKRGRNEGEMREK
ncbi:uncharacterized [Tachysurus ichikawai]